VLNPFALNKYKMMESKIIVGEKDTLVLIFMLLVLGSFILFRSDIINFFEFGFFMFLGLGILLLRARSVRNKT